MAISKSNTDTEGTLGPSDNQLLNETSSRIIRCLNYCNNTEDAATTTKLSHVLERHQDKLSLLLTPAIEFDVVKSIFTPLKSLGGNMSAEKPYTEKIPQFRFPGQNILCYVVEDATINTGKKCHCREKSSEQKCVQRHLKTPTVPKCPCVDGLQIKPQFFSKKITPTRSMLEFAIQHIEEKCAEKDCILEMLIHELALQPDIEMFKSLAQKITNKVTAVPDYSVGMLEQGVLPECECITGELQPNECACLCSCLISPKPLKICSIKRLSATTIVIKWKRAASEAVIAYEIYLNGLLVRFAHGDNDSAIVTADTPLGAFQISIYAITDEGRCYPEATAIIS